MSAVIKRSIDENHFTDLARDTGFLVERIRRERGELDLRLRDNYFNLYYKGNSMAKVRVLPGAGGYEVSIHRKFTDEADTASSMAELKGYSVQKVAAADLPHSLSKQNLNRIASRIKKVNWGEEVAFEQMLITDNPPRPEFMIIDRQITGGALGRQRLDLLALQKVGTSGDEYGLVILEVKLGNNAELEGDVLEHQLRGYIRTLTDDQANFARCYEETYRQMQIMGLLGEAMPSEIQIVGPVRGTIVVGGYSGIASDAILKLRQLKKERPDPVDELISIWRRPSILTKDSEGL